MKQTHKQKGLITDLSFEVFVSNVGTGQCSLSTPAIFIPIFAEIWCFPGPDH